MSFEAPRLVVANGLAPGHCGTFKRLRAYDHLGPRSWLPASMTGQASSNKPSCRDRWQLRLNECTPRPASGTPACFTTYIKSCWLQSRRIALTGCGRGGAPLFVRPQGSRFMGNNSRARSATHPRVPKRPTETLFYSALCLGHSRVSAERRHRKRLSISGCRARRVG
jgi:hypothetical protein